MEPRPPSMMPPRPGIPLRWGIGDFVWIYLVGLLAGQLGAAVGFAISAGTTPDSDVSGSAEATGLTLALAIGAMYVAYSVSLVLVSKLKGRGSLALDFGVAVKAKRMWALFVGIGLQVVLGLMVYPLSTMIDNEKQGVVETLRDSSGGKRAVLLLAAGVLAPIFEEVLFRGLLLRALRRRLTVEMAIGLQALIFAAAHLIDPSLGTVVVLPALFALGAISGIAAVWVGDLSISIPLHIGFNLLTVATFLTLN